MRTCTSCGKEKEFTIENFRNRNGKPSGNTCRVCKRKKELAWIDQNRERKRSYSRRYRQRHLNDRRRKDREIKRKATILNREHLRAGERRRLALYSGELNDYYMRRKYKQFIGNPVLMELARIHLKLKRELKQTSYGTRQKKPA